MKVLYVFIIFLLLYIFVDFCYSRKGHETPKYYRLLFYLTVFSAYAWFLSTLDTTHFDTIYFGIPNQYWFYFVSFIGVFIITFFLDIIFISQKNIIEITTSGIKFSEKNQQLLEKQTNYLKHFENLLAIENDIIQNTAEYVKIEGYYLLDALLLVLADNDTNIDYDELTILSHYLMNYFNKKDPYHPAKVMTYEQQDLDRLAYEFHLNRKEISHIEEALLAYDSAYNRSDVDNVEELYHIDENHLLMKKEKDHYVVIFCYFFQHLGRNIVIAISSSTEILHAELIILSNILMSFEQHYFAVCHQAIEMYRENPS